MTSLGVTLDPGRLEAIGARLGASNGQISYAIREAANHAARVAQRRGRAKMTAGLSVSLAALRRRIKRTTAQGVRASGKVRYSSSRSATNLREAALVWFGLNPVDPFDLSTPPVYSTDRATKQTGVQAGRYRWDGAFMGRRKRGSTGQRSDDLAVFMRRGKSRLPIVRQFADIDAKGFEIISGSLFPLIADEFYRRFEIVLTQELARG